VGTAWTAAILEDEANVRQEVIDYLEGETFAFGRLKTVSLEDFATAIEMLGDRKIDLLIIDVFRGSTDGGDAAGIDVLKEWKTVGFGPVIVYTALPESVKGETSPFVRVVAKEAGGLEQLRGQIEELFALRIPQIYRAIADHVERSLTAYMWGFVASNWSEVSGLAARPDFLRLLLSRLALQFSREGVTALVEQVYPGSGEADPSERQVHPAEYYVKPPLSVDPQLGDIRVLQRKDGPLEVVVLWPTCDLVSRKDGACKVDRALCARVVPLGECEEYQKWVKAENNSTEKDVRRLIKNTRVESQADRFHFIPPAWDIPGGLIDFQQLEHVPVDELKNAGCRATVASPYAESISSRLVRYLGRLGTPDLDIALTLAAIRPKGGKAV
jgi:hypothetical protein